MGPKSADSHATTLTKSIGAFNFSVKLIVSSTSSSMLEEIHGFTSILRFKTKLAPTKTPPAVVRVIPI
ncbi:hypothetical protein KEJ26_05025 [Candidatus Bathyarchaeota archaeon]|nr:hypothetical protein [Candidatus Bathyarchaeota archaeon]